MHPIGFRDGISVHSKFIDNMINPAGPILDNLNQELLMNLDLLPAEIVNLAAAYRSSPHFALAANHFVQRYLNNFKGNFVLNHLSSSELHHLIAAYLFYLHYWRDPDDPTSGVTLSRVQAFCTERRLAGPRKVAALLGVVQASGYFVKEKTEIDARVKVLRPTSKATSVLYGVVGSHISSIEILEQTGRYKKYMDSSPDAVIAISSHGFQLLYMSGVRIVDAVEELKPFLEMDSALKIVFSAYVHKNASLVYNTSFGLLSRVFGISRTQAQRVLEKAEENQQLQILAKGGRQIQLMPSLITLIDIYVSIYLAAMALGARHAIDFDRAKAIPGQDTSHIG